MANSDKLIMTSDHMIFRAGSRIFPGFYRFVWAFSQKGNLFPRWKVWMNQWINESMNLLEWADKQQVLIPLSPKEALGSEKYVPVSNLQVRLHCTSKFYNWPNFDLFVHICLYLIKRWCVLVIWQNYTFKHWKPSRSHGDMTWFVVCAWIQTNINK